MTFLFHISSTPSYSFTEYVCTNTQTQQVMFNYQGRSRYIGMFNNLDDATLANQIARDMLPRSEGIELPQEEIKSNIQRAKDAVTMALSGICSNGESESGDDESTSEEKQIDPMEPNTDSIPRRKGKYSEQNDVSESRPPSGVSKQGNKWVSACCFY